VENKRVLITGATGFLGSHLLKRLVEDGNEVSILKRSTSCLFRLKGLEHQYHAYNIDEIAIETCVEMVRPGMVVHCATDYGRKNVDPSVIIEANLTLPLKLLEVCPKYQVKCFINTDTYLDKRINYYSLSKRQFKEWLTTYSNDLICVNIILEHFYGPFDGHTKFVSFIVEQLLLGVPEINLTFGQQKRDFIYIDDVVNSFGLVLQHVDQLSNALYDFGIGTNVQIKIKDLVELAKKLSGNTITRLNFGAIPYRENEIMDFDIDTKAIRDLGWRPAYAIEKGLEKMIHLEKQFKK
jgi:CDP-paratose synthetase